MKLLSLLVVLSGAGSAWAQGEPPKNAEPILPIAWHGVWKGMLTSWSGKQTRTFSMALRIQPIKGSDRLTWEITYIAGEKKQVRPYELVLVDRDRGSYSVDEKNSIKLPLRLHGSALYSHFEVGNTKISVSYRLFKDRMQVELQSFTVDSRKRTGKDPIKVLTWECVSVQRAELKRTE